AHALERGGAAVLALCANTAHVHLPSISSAVTLPFISIVDAVSREISHGGHRRIAVLATARTSDSGIFGNEWANSIGCETIAISHEQQSSLDRIIREGASAGRFTAPHTEEVQAILH